MVRARVEGIRGRFAGAPEHRLDQLVTEGRSENNFDLIRLAAALMVVFAHSFDLVLHQEPLTELAILSWGLVGVLIFFSISGFLVTRSWDYDPRLGAFAAKRALRLFPGLAVVLIVCAVLLGPLASTLSPGAYFQNPATKAYVLENIVLQTDYTLPGVFGHIVYPNAVNGSLWTLALEVKAYFLLAVVGVAAVVVRARAVMLVLTVYAVLAMFPSIRQSLPGGAHYGAFLLDNQMPSNFVSMFKSTPTADPEFFDFLAGFGVGCGLYVLRRFIPVVWPVAVAFLAAIVLSVVVAGRLSVIPSEITVIVLPYLLLCVAYRSHDRVRLPRWWGDYSYGIYIYAFPIQQVVSELLTPHSGWVMFAVSAPITLLFAAASWHFVERRALGLKRAFGGSTAEAAAPLSA